ncbi:rab effector Noc2 isoform X2 [Haemorhous mexicanus]|uniref:rab effector Noc2 isoform X2 n=1 Tax=Haemorhous mexicanus TaxID=30427 RepID=UPI0028BEA350|nr:rab effector Noc2 isoform X2 [Haemorhous mexicanus]
MADMIFGSGSGPWVCPNDRQLALRAKLQTGWSVHTFQTEKQRKMQALSPKELELILGVIRKAEQLDVAEQQRVGRLVERLENMRKNAMGNGLSQCLLCGEMLGLLGSSSVFCQDCKKVWKRSGAWFYKGLPKYIVPLKSSSSSKALELQSQPWQGEPESVGSGRSFTWARGKVVSSDSESDSELSSSSLDDKPVPVGSKGSQGRKLQAGMAHLLLSLQHPPGDPARPGAEPWGPPSVPSCGGATAAWAVSRGPSSAPRRVARVTKPRAGATATRAPAPLANDEPTAEPGSDGAEDGAALSWIQLCHSSGSTPGRSCCQW